MIATIHSTIRATCRPFSARTLITEAIAIVLGLPAIVLFLALLGGSLPHG